MSTELVTKDNERIKSLFCSLDRLLGRIETVMTGYEPSFERRTVLTVAQVSERLKISREGITGIPNQRQNPLPSIRW